MELARGYWLGALGVLVFAKMLSVGVTAFIFDLTQPKLLQMPWFRWLYDRVMAGLGWAHGLIDPIKRRLRPSFECGSPARGPDIAAARAHPAADAGSLTAVRSGEGSADSQD
jgi:hypothetical protein